MRSVISSVAEPIFCGPEPRAGAGTAIFKAAPAGTDPILSVPEPEPPKEVAAPQHW